MRFVASFLAFSSDFLGNNVDLLTIFGRFLVDFQCFFLDLFRTKISMDFCHVLEEKAGNGKARIS